MKKTLYLLSFTLILFISHEANAQTDKSNEQLISELIQKKRDFNKEYGYGYRIQLYNGFEVEAKKLRAKFKLDYPETKTFLIYQQPEWKIQVGYFKTRIQTDRFLKTLKKKYPYAIVVPLGK